MKLIYLNPYGGNFGDALGVELVRRIVGNEIETVDLWKERKWMTKHGHRIVALVPIFHKVVDHWQEKRRFERGPGVVALGSIFHKVIDGDIVWGTGINPSLQPKKRCIHLDIRAVRGPLTRKYILDYLGQSCPEVYGDPGLLTKKMFPEMKRRPVRKYGIVPHYWDMDQAKEMPNVILPTDPWQDVLQFILGCDLIIASSLHALIAAESFGIPARWWRSSDLKSSKTESAFKYNDYYASTNRSQDDSAVTIEQALKMGGKEPIVNYNYDALLESFPKEMSIGRKIH